jgi:hypothetical protein
MTDTRKRRILSLHLAGPADTPAVAPQEVTVKRFKTDDDETYKKRCASVAALGVRWLRHPAYTFQPIQSVHRDVWFPAHLLFWERVHVAAALDRAKNPACQRAASVRAALGD